MTGDQMFELAQALAAAKSRQDVPAALKLLHADIVLETPAWLDCPGPGGERDRPDAFLQILS
jgi:hypothetical protein